MTRSLSTRLSPVFAFGALLTIAALGGIGSRAAADPVAAKPSIAGTWAIDPMHTEVNFTIEHLLISEVQGRFSDLSGTIIADPANLAKSSVTFTIKAASIDTQVAFRDADLRKKDYFDVDDYPTITFVSTKIVEYSPVTLLNWINSHSLNGFFEKLAPIVIVRRKKNCVIAI